MAAESSVSSSQPLSDVIISYLKASALGHRQKAVQLYQLWTFFAMIL